MIPARYGASRFPGKLMQDLAGKPVIVRTYEAALGTGLFDQVVVVTDSPEIREAVQAVGGTVVMSREAHETGSDRIAEAVEDMEVDIVVNVQGDEPLMPPTLIGELAHTLAQRTAASIADKYCRSLDSTAGPP